MQIYVTKQGGRVVQGDTPHGRFRVEWDADGALVSESIEKPAGPGDIIAAITSAVGIKPCGKCAARRASMNSAGWRGLPGLWRRWAHQHFFRV